LKREKNTNFQISTPGLTASAGSSQLYQENDRCAAIAAPAGGKGRDAI
jgi:hypothetical protein